MKDDVRLIDANAVSRTLRNLPFGYAKSFAGQAALKEVENAPTIDAVPVVHGRWVRAAGKSNIWYCSVCGDKINYKQNRRTYNIPKVPVEQKNKFCRNCGAKMDLVEDTDAGNTM